MPKTKKHKIVTASFLAIILAEILWGINTPVIKLGLQTVPLPLYLSVTILGAALLMAPLAAKNWRPMRRKDYSLLIIGSIISITLGNVALLMGLQRVPAVNASLIGLFGPLILLILSVEFLKERLSLKTFFGILISFFGAAIVIGNPWDITDGGQDAVIGNLLIVLDVFCGVVGILISKSVLKRSDPYQVTFIHLFVGIVPVAVFSLQYLPSLAPSSVGGNGFAAILFNIFAVAVANCLFMYALKHRKAQDIGVFRYVHTIATGIAAWLILAEVPDKKLVIGAVFIFIGIYLAEARLPKKIRPKFKFA